MFYWYKLEQIAHEQFPCWSLPVVQVLGSLFLYMPAVLACRGNWTSSFLRKEKTTHKAGMLWNLHSLII